METLCEILSCEKIKSFIEDNSDYLSHLPSVFKLNYSNEGRKTILSFSCESSKFYTMLYLNY